MNTLLARLTLAFSCILLLLGLSVLWLSNRSSQDYFLEFTQQLNAPIAMYMVENGGFIENNALNPVWLNELAPHVMMVNPSVEVYMLDSEGVIISGSPENSAIKRSRINLQPIHAFLQADRSLPLFGDDPKFISEQRIFSAFPLQTKNEISGEKETVGYVYAVLAGEKYQSILESISNSYSYKSLVTTLLGALLLALFSGIIVFFSLTRRLKALTRKVSQNSFANIPVTDALNDNGSIGQPFDEIDQLAHTYQSMAHKLVKQNDELLRTDANRQEFIENISHDLRTPLTTIQSYLETLILKSDTLSASEERDYIRIAFRKSKHLSRLVAQLLTLTRLESGEINPSFEVFSLLELVHDVVQEFQLKARSKGIEIVIEPASSDNNELDVYADIAMIQRVFENLLANAIRHTIDGTIVLSLNRHHGDYVDINVTDSGCGMDKKQCQQILRRYCTGDNRVAGMAGQSGLGLAIVKNILSLHNSTMQINSKLNVGTSIRFGLPSSQQTLQLTQNRQISTGSITSAM